MKLFFVLGALLFAAPIFSENLEFKSNIRIDNNAKEFGGLSGIVVTDNGASFYAVSDKGTIWKGYFERDDQGVLVSANDLDYKPIKTSKGDDVDRQNIDAEEIDIDAKGNFYISFESNSRVSLFKNWDSNATLIQRPSEFLEFGYNSGPEAMSIGPDNTILVVPERSGKLDRPFPIYTFRDGKWSSDRSIRRDPPYLVVGMDYDPQNERLYILERDFKFPVFSTRIRSFKLDFENVSDEQLLLETNYGEYGNLEGMSLWRDENGTAHLTLIADDNFSAFYNTEIVEFIVHADG